MPSNRFVPALAAVAALAGLADSALAIRVRLDPDALWNNGQPLTPQTPTCRSTVDVEDPTPNQYPPDSHITRIRGTLRAQAVSGPTGVAVGGFFTRGQLNQQQAAGSGFPGGFSTWPDGSQPGQLSGMVWPFRDFMNFGSNVPQVPGGNDNSPGNGAVSSLLITGIDGQQDVDRYGLRSNTGNGISTRMNFYVLDFTVTDFTTPRIIRLSFTDGLADVRTPSGQIFRDQPVEPGFVNIFIPAPAGLPLLALGGLTMARRRR